MNQLAPVVLADGTPFRLGMTVFLPVRGEIVAIETNEADFEINTFIDEGRIYNCLRQREGGGMGTDIGFFYPSRESILDARIKRLESSIREQSELLRRLKLEKTCGS